ncbi:PLP-dependent transferase, partial [Staphylococcus condimenti]|uniref:PLP-dependent transferase n=1 Tax=Staphylococcus condimenti TaxID=70255 RepID=UPI001022E07C
CFIQNSTDGILRPQDSYLLSGGIKTLALRMIQVSRYPVAVSEMLSERPNVERVYHLSLKDHLKHGVQERQASGHTGVVSFVVKDVDAAKGVIRGTE